MRECIKKKIDSLKVRKALLLVLLLSFCVPLINPIFVVSVSVKMFRVVTVAVALLCMIIFGKIRIPSWKVLLVLFGIAIVSFCNYSVLGFERLFFEYIFAFAVLITTYSLGYGLDPKTYISIVKKASLFLLVVVIINMLVQHEAILDFIVEPVGNHPKYDSVFPGGCNLDATWLALFGLFYKDDLKTGYVYIGLSLLTSALLSSRIGILLNFACILYLALSRGHSSRHKRNGGVTAMVLLVAVAAIMASGVGSTVTERLKNVGQDDASLSRMSLWENGVNAISKNPYGYGAGNAVKAIEYNSGIAFDEDNVHNLLLQKTIDFGIAGLIIFLVLIAVFVKYTYKDLFRNPFYMYIYLYLLAGLLQFKGADSITFYMLGLCCVMIKQNRINVKNE